MKRNLIVLLSLSVMLAFIAPVVTNAQAGKANFSGNWAFNADKSNMGQAPAQGQGQGQGRGMGGFGGGNFVAKQEANLLTVERTRTNQQGETTTTTTKYTLDGKESVNTTRMGDSKSVATWSADGKSLTIATTSVFNMNGESREMKSSEVWTLKDANTLSVTRTSATPNGDRTQTMVYDKK
ncbi:MAG: hypothetical protein U0X39_10770 [Bacteroidales bacterium]